MRLEVLVGRVAEDEVAVLGEDAVLADRTVLLLPLRVGFERGIGTRREVGNVWLSVRMKCIRTRMGTLHSYLLDHVLHDESAVHVKALDLFWHITLQRLREGGGGCVWVVILQEVSL